jgi:phage-related protein
MARATWTVLKYKTASGRRLITKYVNELVSDDQYRAQRQFERLAKYGIQWGPPHVKHVQDNIYRLKLQTNHGHHRFLFFLFRSRYFVILHAFRKQTNAIPQKDIDIAIRRRDDFISRVE